MLAMVILGAFGGAIAGALIGHVRFDNPLVGMFLGAALGAAVLYAFSDSPSAVVAVETPDQFDTNVLNWEGPVVVDFYADWCGPCRKLAPTIKSLADQYAGEVKFVKINVDKGHDVAAYYGVRSIPTVMLFVGGEVVHTWMGARPAEHYREVLDAVVGAQ